MAGVRARVVDAVGPDAHEVVAALVDAISPLSADLDLSDVLSHIISGACELIGARYGALGVVGPDGRHLSGFYTHGISADEAERIGPFPQGRGVLGLLVEEPRPVRLHDLTAHPRSGGIPEHHPPMRTLLGVPIRIRGTVFGNLYLAEKRDGSDFSVEDESLLVALAGQAGVAIDNARMYALSEVRQRWSQATSTLVQSLLEAESDDPSIALMAAQVRELSGGLLTAVALLDPAGRLEIRAIDRARGRGRGRGAAVGPDDPTGAILVRPEWHDVLTAGHPILHVPGGATDPRSIPADAAREVLGLPPDTAVALVPLGAGTRAIGVLVTGWHVRDEIRAQEALPLQATYALQTGVAVLAAQAHADQGRVDLLEERERIARDMHDNVIQRLFAVGLSLQSAGPLAIHPVVRSRINRAVDELDTAIKEIRQAIFALHHDGPGGTLLSVLRAISGSYAVSLGFLPEVTVAPGLAPLSEALTADVVAVVREALANVARHARAHSVRLEVSDGDGVTVEVVDDGVGFDPSRARSGLVHLAERAAAHGGVFEIRRGDPSGTVLRWHVPDQGGVGP